MKNIKITLYIACVLIVVHLINANAGCSCSYKTKLENCQNDFGIAQTNYNAVIALLQSLVPNIQKQESCEVANNKFECSAGKVIKILHGFYGVIPGHACTKEQKTNTCMAARDQVMSWIPKSCERSQTCHIIWEKNRPDPCHGTSKVLVIYYLCLTPSQG